jgi:hypothetical protein
MTPFIFASILACGFVPQARIINQEVPRIKGFETSYVLNDGSIGYSNASQLLLVKGNARTILSDPMVPGVVGLDFRHKTTDWVIVGDDRRIVSFSAVYGIRRSASLLPQPGLVRSSLDGSLLVQFYDGSIGHAMPHSLECGPIYQSKLVINGVGKNGSALGCIKLGKGEKALRHPAVQYKSTVTLLPIPKGFSEAEVMLQSKDGSYFGYASNSVNHSLSNSTGRDRIVIWKGGRSKIVNVPASMPNGKLYCHAILDDGTLVGSYMQSSGKKNRYGIFLLIGDKLVKLDTSLRLTGGHQLGRPKDISESGLILAPLNSAKSRSVDVVIKINLPIPR